MKLVMTLLTFDSRDIVDVNIRYHLEQGVDHIIVTDNASSDGTPEILEAYAREGYLTLIHEPAEEYAQRQWVTRMARMAATEHGADWVINNDDDEFWWPREGNLKDALEAVPPDIGVVLAARTDFVARPGYGFFADRMVVRELASYDLIGRRLPPRAAHRGTPEITIGMGGHKAGARGLTTQDWPGIEVFHFPVRGIEQLERRALSAERALPLEHQTKTKVARHWQRALDMQRAGRLHELYEELLHSDARVQERLQAGEVVIDRRLTDFLHERCPPEEQVDDLRERLRRADRDLERFAAQASEQAAERAALRRALSDAEREVDWIERHIAKARARRPKRPARGPPKEEIGAVQSDDGQPDERALTEEELRRALHEARRDLSRARPLARDRERLRRELKALHHHLRQAHQTIKRAQDAVAVSSEADHDANAAAEGSERPAGDGDASSPAEPSEHPAKKPRSR